MALVLGKTELLRRLEYMLDNGTVIELDVKDCKEECPFNHHEFCNCNKEKPYYFKMIDVSDMKQFGFPEMCPLPLSEEVDN